MQQAGDKLHIIIAAGENKADLVLLADGQGALHGGGKGHAAAGLSQNVTVGGHGVEGLDKPVSSPR